MRNTAIGVAVVRSFMKRWPSDFGLQARMMLTLVLIGLLNLAFLAFLYWLGLDPVSLLVIAAVMLGIQYFFSDKMVLASTRAKVVTPEQAPELHQIVEQLSAEAGIPKPRVAIVPTNVPNAFATGRSLHHSVIAVTNGLMERLNTDEVKAVLAHELSHVRNRDVAVITLASFLATVASFMMNSAMFGSMYGGNRDRRGGGGMILVFIVSAIVYFFGMLLVRMLSRYREYSADRGSAIITGHPSHLISALMKISGVMDRVPKKDLRAPEGMNQFFIVPQLTGRSLMELFSTHPPIEKRIRQLERMEQTLGP
ncbi:MAG TPA: zinc metalloprotease HtpX [Methanocella sp.]|jgi:heat shock protein HtpX